MGSDHAIAIINTRRATHWVEFSEDADTTIGGDEMRVKVKQYVKVFRFDCGSENGHWSLVTKQ
jgi:hypothetical protein